MKALLITIAACAFIGTARLNAQDQNVTGDSTAPQTITDKEQDVRNADQERGSRRRAETGTGNDKTFRDDSTDAAMGMSGLDATPGTSTTSGAGGLGTNENPGYNTSSDIYNIERRDSIKKAKEKEKGASQQKVNTRGE